MNVLKADYKIPEYWTGEHSLVSPLIGTENQELTGNLLKCKVFYPSHLEYAKHSTVVILKELHDARNATSGYLSSFDGVMN